MSRFLLSLVTCTGFAALPAAPAAALFHLSVIDEVMTSLDGDADVQFVEIRMFTQGQSQVEDSVLAVFDANGTYVSDVLLVPGTLAVANTDTRWIMGTTAFEAAAGIQADFEFAPALPLGGGMVCWGAPGLVPPAPASWDHTVPANYIDCLAYGSYAGPTNVHIGDPTPLLPEGHSLRRASETDDNATDFVCADPADPTNDGGGSASLPATTPCPEPGGALLLLAGGGVLLAAGRRRKTVCADS